MDSSQSKKMWLRYDKDDTACFKAINNLSKNATSSLQVLRQMKTKTSKSVLAKMGVEEIEGLRKSIPCIRDIVPDPARYPIVGPVYDINRRDLFLIWEGQARSYGFDLVQADKLHARGLTGEGITVCIIDSGFDSTHEDFDLTKFSGVSDAEGTDWSTDEYGHGTLSAGIIAAQDNDLGLIGVAPGVSVFVVKQPDNFSASDSMLAAEQCRDNGAQIISMSFSGESLDEEEEFFADLFNIDGVLSVASAGNSGFNEVNYPASYPFVISVGAINRIPEIASFSTYNDFVDIVAPGVAVWSTLPDNFDCTICSETPARNYASYDGTSASAPFVSGIAALLWSFDPTMNVTYVNNALLASALDAGQQGRDPYYGQGILQGDAAFETLKATLNGTEEIQDWTVVDNPVEPDRCTPDEYSVVVDIVSDAYPDEVFWQVSRMGDGFPVLAGSGTDSATKCLPKNCYSIQVLDAAGDGICCDYGRGYLTVAVDDVVILTATNFTDSVEAEFGDSCVPLDFDSKVPCVTFSVEFTSDGFPYENFVLLEDLETEQIWWDDIVLEFGLNSFSQCINPASCTAFTVFDSYGDGIDGGVSADDAFPIDDLFIVQTGNLVLTFDGDEFFNGVPEFTTEFSWFVGDGCVNNSTGLE